MDRATNALISPAAADVARHAKVDVVVRGTSLFTEQHSCSHDLSRLAITTLRHVLGNPRLLQRTSKLRQQTFDRNNLLSLGARNRRYARAHCFAIEVNGAGAALSHPTAEFGSRQPKRLAEHPEQRCRRIDIDLMPFSIDVECGHKRPSFSNPSPRLVTAGDGRWQQEIPQAILLEN